MVWCNTCSTWAQPTHIAEYAADLREVIAGQWATRRGGDDTLVVPVVFHVLHQRGAEHLGDERILIALDQLNIGLQRQPPGSGRSDQHLPTHHGRLSDTVRTRHIGP
jgi:hypothetical protein